MIGRIFIVTDYNKTGPIVGEVEAEIVGFMVDLGEV